MSRHIDHIPFRGALVAALSLFAVTGLAVPGPASASIACGISGNWHNGKISGAPSGNYVNGARANIERTDHPALCSPGTDKSFSDAWAMVASTASGYAQIGYEWSDLYSPNNSYYFTEIDSGNGLPAFTKWGQPAVGSNHNFSVHTGASGLLYLDLDGVTQQTTWFSMTGTWPGSMAQWMEEISNLSDDVFGDTTDKVRFGSTDLRNSAGNWVNPNYGGPPSSKQCFMNTNVITQGTSFDAWTDPKNHNC